MRVDSDVDMEEDQVDVEVEEAESIDDVEETSVGDVTDHQSEEEEDEIQSAEGEEEEEEEDEELSVVPTLKIKLKIPSQATLSSGTATPVRGLMSPSKASRRYRPIESEDETEDVTPSDTSGNEQSRSRSTGTPTNGTRPMTTRQAVLASVVGSSHVSLNEGSRSKKQPLNETELALRREETARKRRNLTEKKLEDEKAETINRLLKRQSRPRQRRMAADAIQQENAEEGEGEEGMEGIQQVHEEAKPVMYRWISTSRPQTNSGQDAEKKMSITFSVPTIVEIPSHPPKRKEVILPLSPVTCAVEGCGQVRKYRFVNNSNIGACGMPHLKLLEGR
ncbi:hypothetical protein AX17_005685 [Amanita inopinata Kibby_2008]|nr:hypothetical protein AX17_005685 [Amanita inopinata Kibby_2008]